MIALTCDTSQRFVQANDAVFYVWMWLKEPMHTLGTGRIPGRPWLIALYLAALGARTKKWQVDLIRF